MKTKKLSNVDVIVAGAGIWGCTVARTLADAGKNVLLVDGRDKIGGNAACEMMSGIEVHTYGSHIFHTSIPRVWSFLSRFTKFNGYQHHVIARTKYDRFLCKCDCAKDYFLPFGLPLFNSFFNVNLKPDEVESFLKTDSAVESKTNRDVLFDVFIKNYTAKQWGKPAEEVDSSIIRRIPMRNNYDVNYFKDMLYGIPGDGFDNMFANMVGHDNIDVVCLCSLTYDGERFSLFNKSTEQTEYIDQSIPIFYSGPIDKLFNFKYGSLPWRTLGFETETLDMNDYQGNSVVNYSDDDVPYTRIHEFKHYHPEWKETMNSNVTVIMKEYPSTWKNGDEPYYPVSSDESQCLYEKYANDVVEINKVRKLVVGGRLGEYKYLDMDKTVDAALDAVEKNNIL